MTIEVEGAELVTAVCDRCGERQILDLDAEAEPGEIAAELKLCGWARNKPERQRFESTFGSAITVVYDQDFCQDCRSDEPAPKPRFGTPRPWTPSVGAFVNDPCDEWPRALVFAAVGLRETCGHPAGPDRCAYCEAGHPVGRVSAWWR